MPPTKKQNLRDHDQLPVTAWKGLYSNGMDDAVPVGFFIDSLNTSFETIEVRSRDGFTRIFDKPNIRRFFVYKRLNETPRYLILDTSGSLWDSLYSTPLVTDSSYLDFSALNYLNRAYITFHDRVSGIAGSVLQVYEGEGPGTLRAAGGSAPVGFNLVCSMSANSGNLGLGTYLVAVCYETSTGFITAPGPAVFGSVDSPGGFKLNVDGIAPGPTGTIARRLLITKSIPTDLYTGNQFGYEFFFCPNGRIGDNTTTSLHDIDFFDDDLADSADYLFDSRSTIPAGLGLTIYNNRMCLWGVDGFEHYVFISKAIFVETFDETSGLLFLDPSDSISSITNVVDHETSLFIQTQDRTYVTVDNGSDPDTWRCDPLDKAIGAEIFSISKILDSRGTSVKRFFQGDKSGIYVYEGGGFQDPPFTVNIIDLWNRINKNQFNKVQLVDDPENKIIYAAVPLDNSVECSHVLVGDYYSAFNRYGQLVGGQVRWSLWAFPWQVSTIVIDTNHNAETVFKQAGFEGNIYEQDSSVDLDDNNKVTSYIQTHLYTSKSKAINHFGFLEARVEGVGYLQIYLYGVNNKKIMTPPRWTLIEDTDIYYQKPINFVGIKMSVKLMSSVNAGDKFKLFDLSVDSKSLWAETPRINPYAVKSV
jgi:hypothetical protein